MATILRQGFNFVRGSWKGQELAKGGSWLTSPADFVLSRGQAGWRRNLLYVSFPPPPVTDEKLKTDPFFSPFLEADLIDPDPSVASARAGEPTVQYDLLARGLPALSYAAAVDRVPVLHSVDRNFDIEVDGRTAGQWPTEGHDTKDTRGRWLHGDVKDVALPYLWRMYDAMIERGALR